MAQLVQAFLVFLQMERKVFHNFMIITVQLVIASIHACEIKSNCLVGMGSVILDSAVLEEFLLPVQ